MTSFETSFCGSYLCLLSCHRCWCLFSPWLLWSACISEFCWQSLLFWSLNEFYSTSGPQNCLLLVLLPVQEEIKSFQQLIYILALATYLTKVWYLQKHCPTLSICLLYPMPLPVLWSSNNLISFVLLFFSRFLKVDVSLVSSFNFVPVRISSSPLNLFPT